MKVLDLQCSQAHSFEGWFSSEDEFQDQLARGIVSCPLCGDATVTKMLSAPRLNLGAARKEEPRQEHLQEQDSIAQTVQYAIAPVDDQQAKWVRAMRTVFAKVDDVGDKFAQEVRSMHYGEKKARTVRGMATPQERQELLDEGIDVMSLALPDSIKETLQ